MSRLMDGPTPSRKLLQGSPRLVPRWIELFIVNDYFRFTQRDDPLFCATEDVVNHIDALFKNAEFDPPLRVRLVCQETWADRNRIPYTFISARSNQVDANALLSAFDNYRIMYRSTLPVYDHATLYTGADMEGTVNGLAQTSTMCTFPSSSSIVAVLPRSVVLNAALAAHELGHSLGMSHDGQQNYCPNGNIMEAAVGNPPNQWSDCSRQYLSTFFKLHNPTCLSTEEPRRGRSVPNTCGDGYIGEGEACDCGRPDCTTVGDMCCDGATCQLKRGAQCARTPGTPCCGDNCMPVAPGRVCRPSTQVECDQPEYCNGFTAECPPDIFYPPGATCVSTALDKPFPGLCYQGICWSVDAQCYSQGFPRGCSDPLRSVSQDQCGDLWCILGPAGCGLVLGAEGGRLQMDDGVACGRARGTQCYHGQCVPSSQLPGGEYVTTNDANVPPDPRDCADSLKWPLGSPFSISNTPIASATVPFPPPSPFSNVFPLPPPPSQKPTPPPSPRANSTLLAANGGVAPFSDDSATTDIPRLFWNYEQFRGAVLPSNNNGQYFGSVVDCMRSCGLEPTCKSFDYVKDNGQCTWSQRTKEQVPLQIDSRYDYYQKLILPVALYHNRTFHVPTGLASSYRIAEPYGAFTGAELMYWSSTRDCNTPTTSISRFGTFMPRQPGVTTEITLLGVAPGRYELCFTPAGSIPYTLVRDIVLIVEPLRLVPNQSWLRETGEQSSLEVLRAGEGLFSGAETVFWTLEPHCLLTTLDAAVYCPMEQGNDGMASFTLRNLIPGLYHLCYDNGLSPTSYEFQSGITLRVVGVRPVSPQSFAAITGGEPTFSIAVNSKGHFSGLERAIFVPIAFMNTGGCPLLSEATTVEGMDATALGGTISPEAKLSVSLWGVRPGRYALCYDARNVAATGATDVSNRANNIGIAIRQASPVRVIDASAVRVSESGQVANNVNPSLSSSTTVVSRGMGPISGSSNNNTLLVESGFVAFPGITLVVDGVRLRGIQNGGSSFVSGPGEEVSFRLEMEPSSVGTFSGFERVFWSSQPENIPLPCSPVSTDSTIAGVIEKGPLRSKLLPSAPVQSRTTLMSLRIPSRTYRLCYDNGTGYFEINAAYYAFFPNVTLQIVGAKLFLPQTFSGVTGTTQRFPLLADSFSGKEVFFWTANASNCTIAPPSSGSGSIEIRADGNDISSPVSLVGLAPGLYFLCFDFGNGAYGQFPDVTLDLAPVVLAPNDFGTRLTGQPTNFTFRTTVGGFSGSESFFWTQLPDCITDNIFPASAPKKMSPTSPSLSGTISPLGFSSELSLLGAALGVYTLCFNDGLGIPRPHRESALKIVGIRIATPQEKDAVTGQQTTFFLEESSLGRFNGMEQFFWTPVGSDCLFDATTPVFFSSSSGVTPTVRPSYNVNVSTIKSPLFATLSTGTDGGAWSSVMSLERAPPGLYFLCYDDSSFSFTPYPSVVLNLQGPTLIASARLRYFTGESPVVSLLPFSSSSFSGVETIFWTPQRKKSCNINDNNYDVYDDGEWEIKRKTISPTPASYYVPSVFPVYASGQVFLNLSYKTPGLYYLCLNSGNGNNTFKLYSNVTLEVFPVVLDVPISLTLTTGQSGVLHYKQSSIGHFSLKENMAWSSSPQCDLSVPFAVNSSIVSFYSGLGETRRVDFTGVLPGTYYLCYGIGNGSVWRVQNAVLSVLPVSPLPATYDFLTGEIKALTLTPTEGRYTLKEVFYFELADQACSFDRYKTSTNKGSLLSPLGVTSPINFVGASPGVYVLCLAPDNKANPLVFVRHNRTTVSGHGASLSLNQSFFRYSGEETTFELRAFDGGAFNGHERLYWQLDSGQDRCMDEDVAAVDPAISGSIASVWIRIVLIFGPDGSNSSLTYGTTTKMSLQGLPTSQYVLCFDNTEGKGFVLRADIRLSVEAVGPSQSQLFSRTTGQLTNFYLIDSTPGQYSTLERVFWTRGKSCDPVPADPDSIFSGGIEATDMEGGNTTLMSLLGMVPARYALCFSDGGPNFFLYPGIVLDLSGVIPAPVYFTKALGDPLTDQLAVPQATLGSWSGLESFFWVPLNELNPASETCNQTSKDVNNQTQGIFLPQLNGRGKIAKTSTVTFRGGSPAGMYTMCFNDGSSEFKLVSHVLLNLTTPEFIPAVFTVFSGQPMTFFLPHTGQGLFSGTEVVYWLPSDLNECNNFVVPDSVVATLLPNAVTTHFSFAGTTPGIYALCFAPALGKPFRLVKVLTLTVKPVILRPQHHFRVRGRATWITLITPETVGTFHGQEHMYWINASFPVTERCPLPDPDNPAFWGLSPQTMNFTSFLFSLVGSQPGDYELCYDASRSGVFLRNQDVVLSVTGILPDNVVTDPIDQVPVTLNVNVGPNPQFYTFITGTENIRFNFFQLDPAGERGVFTGLERFVWGGTSLHSCPPLSSVPTSTILNLGHSSLVSLRGVAPGSYSLCYDDGRVIFNQFPRVVLAVTAMTLAAPQFFRGTTGVPRSFTFEKGLINGSFSGSETVFWTKGDNCSVVLPNSRLYENGTTEVMWVSAPQPPGFYQLCYDGGYGIFVYQPNIHLYVQGIRLTSNLSFTTVTGAPISFDLAALASGPFILVERFFFTLSSTECDELGSPFATTNALSGKFTQQNVTTALTLLGVQPGLYSLCFHNGEDPFVMTQITLRVLGVEIISQAEYRATGEPSSFTFAAPKGEFFGGERMFWSSNNCAFPDFVALGYLDQASFQGTFQSIGRNRANSSTFLFLGMPCGTYSMCFDSGETGEYILQPNVSLTLTCVSPIGGPYVGTTGQPQVFNFVPNSVGNFSGKEQFFWESDTKTGPSDICKEVEEQGKGTLQIVLSGVTYNFYSTSVPLRGLKPGFYHLCFDDVGPRNGTRSIYKPIPDARLALQGITLVESISVGPITTGARTKLQLPRPVSGLFTGYEIAIWTTATDCNAFANVPLLIAPFYASQRRLLLSEPHLEEFSLFNNISPSKAVSLKRKLLQGDRYDSEGKEFMPALRPSIAPSLRKVSVVAPSLRSVTQSPSFAWSPILADHYSISFVNDNGSFEVNSNRVPGGYFALRPGTYSLCFDNQFPFVARNKITNSFNPAIPLEWVRINNNNHTYTRYPNSTLNVRGVKLARMDMQTWTTGQTKSFVFSIDGEGQFSGYERVFWTLYSSCAIITTNPTVFGMMSRAHNATSPMTFVGEPPGIYRLCYDSGLGWFEYRADIMLRLVGVALQDSFWKYTGERTAFDFVNAVGRFTGRERMFWTPNLQCTQTTRSISIFPSANSRSSLPVSLTALRPAAYTLCYDDGSEVGFKRLTAQLRVQGIVLENTSPPVEAYTGQTVLYFLVESTPGQFSGFENLFWTPQQNPSCGSSPLVVTKVPTGNAQVKIEVSLWGFAPGYYVLCFDNADGVSLYVNWTLFVKPVVLKEKVYYADVNTLATIPLGTILGNFSGLETFFWTLSNNCNDYLSRNLSKMEYLNGDSKSTPFQTSKQPLNFTLCFNYGLTQANQNDTNRNSFEFVPGVKLVVADLIPPRFVGCPEDMLFVAVKGETSITTASFPFLWVEPIPYDNVDLTPIRYSNFHFGEVLRAGKNYISYWSKDSSGNIGFCNFTVQVNLSRPNINGPPSMIFETDPGWNTQVVDWQEPSLDMLHAASLEMTTTANPGDEFPIGITPVTYTVTDMYGTTASYTFNVTVIDPEPPVLTCPVTQFFYRPADFFHAQQPTPLGRSDISFRGITLPTAPRSSTFTWDDVMFSLLNISSISDNDVVARALNDITQPRATWYDNDRVIGPFVTFTYPNTTTSLPYGRILIDLTVVDPSEHVSECQYAIEIRDTPCRFMPCWNEGICVYPGVLTSTSESLVLLRPYTCRCVNNYFGYWCEKGDVSLELDFRTTDPILGRMSREILARLNQPDDRRSVISGYNTTIANFYTVPSNIPLRPRSIDVSTNLTQSLLTRPYVFGGQSYPLSEPVTMLVINSPCEDRPFHCGANAAGCNTVYDEDNRIFNFACICYQNWTGRLCDIHIDRPPKMVLRFNNVHYRRNSIIDVIQDATLTLDVTFDMNRTRDPSGNNLILAFTMSTMSGDFEDLFSRTNTHVGNIDNVRSDKVTLNGTARALEVRISQLRYHPNSSIFGESAIFLNVTSTEDVLDNDSLILPLTISRHYLPRPKLRPIIPDFKQTNASQVGMKWGDFYAVDELHPLPTEYEVTMQGLGSDHRILYSGNTTAFILSQRSFAAFSDNLLPSGTRRLVRVRAKNLGGWNEPSDWTALATSLPVPDTVNITRSVRLQTFFELEWIKQPTSTLYVISYHPIDNNAAVTTVSTPFNNMTVSLPFNQGFVFVVKAQNGEGVFGPPSVPVYTSAQDYINQITEFVALPSNSLDPAKMRVQFSGNCRDIFSSVTGVSESGGSSNTDRCEAPLFNSEELNSADIRNVISLTPFSCPSILGIFNTTMHSLELTLGASCPRPIVGSTFVSLVDYPSLSSVQLRGSWDLLTTAGSIVLKNIEIINFKDLGISVALQNFTSGSLSVIVKSLDNSLAFSLQDQAPTNSSITQMEFQGRSAQELNSPLSRLAVRVLFSSGLEPLIHPIEVSLRSVNRPIALLDKVVGRVVETRLVEMPTVIASSSLVFVEATWYSLPVSISGPISNERFVVTLTASQIALLGVLFPTSGLPTNQSYRFQLRGNVGELNRELRSLQIMSQMPLLPISQILSFVIMRELVPSELRSTQVKYTVVCDANRLAIATSIFEKNLSSDNAVVSAHTLSLKLDKHLVVPIVRTCEQFLSSDTIALLGRNIACVPDLDHVTLVLGARANMYQLNNGTKLGVSGGTQSCGISTVPVQPSPGRTLSPIPTLFSRAVRQPTVSLTGPISSPFGTPLELYASAFNLAGVASYTWMFSASSSIHVIPNPNQNVVISTFPIIRRFPVNNATAQYIVLSGSSPLLNLTILAPTESSITFSVSVTNLFGQTATTNHTVVVTQCLFVRVLGGPSREVSPSEGVSLRSAVFSRCQTNGLHLLWSVTPALTSFPTTASDVDIPSWTLRRGVKYLFTLEVYFDDTNTQVRYSMVVNVINELFLGVQGGTNREIQRTQPLSLEAVAFPLLPSEDSPNLAYTWSCRALDGSICGARNDNPLVLPQSSTLFLAAGSLEEDIYRFSVSANSSAGIVVVPGPDVIVRVVRADSSATSLGTECVRSSLLTINPNSMVILRPCSNYPPGAIFRWSSPSMQLSRSDTAELILNRGLDPDYFVGGRRYIFLLEIFSASTPYLWQEIHLQVTEPPHVLADPEIIKVSPSTGVGMLTNFGLFTQGWDDINNYPRNAHLTFQFFWSLAGSDPIYLHAPISEPFFSVLLPPGDLVIGVRTRSSTGAEATATTTIHVDPASVVSVNDLANQYANGGIIKPVEKTARIGSYIASLNKLPLSKDGDEQNQVMSAWMTELGSLTNGSASNTESHNMLGALAVALQSPLLTPLSPWSDGLLQQALGLLKCPDGEVSIADSQTILVLLDKFSEVFRVLGTVSDEVLSHWLQLQRCWSKLIPSLLDDGVGLTSLVPASTFLRKYANDSTNFLIGTTPPKLARVQINYSPGVPQSRDQLLTSARLLAVPGSFSKNLTRCERENFLTPLLMLQANTTFDSMLVTLSYSDAECPLLVCEPACYLLQTNGMWHRITPLSSSLTTTLQCLVSVAEEWPKGKVSSLLEEHTLMLAVMKQPPELCLSEIPPPIIDMIPSIDMVIGVPLVVSAEVHMPVVKPNNRSTSALMLKYNWESGPGRNFSGNVIPETLAVNLSYALVNLADNSPKTIKMTAVAAMDVRESYPATKTLRFETFRPEGPILVGAQLVADFEADQLRILLSFSIFTDMASSNCRVLLGNTTLVMLSGNETTPICTWRSSDTLQISNFAIKDIERAVASGQQFWIEMRGGVLRSRDGYTHFMTRNGAILRLDALSLLPTPVIIGQNLVGLNHNLFLDASRTKGAYDGKLVYQWSINGASVGNEAALSLNRLTLASLRVNVTLGVSNWIVRVLRFPLVQTTSAVVVLDAGSDMGDFQFSTPTTVSLLPGDPLTLKYQYTQSICLNNQLCGLVISRDRITTSLLWQPNEVLTCTLLPIGRLYPEDHNSVFTALLAVGNRAFSSVSVSPRIAPSRLVEARFSDSCSRIIITFSYATPMPGGRLSHDCAQVFANAGDLGFGFGASCFWAHPRQYVVLLGSLQALGPRAVRVADVVELKDASITNLEGPLTLAIQAPQLPPRVAAIVTGPTVISTCAQFLTLDGSQSRGSAGRPFEIMSWTTKYPGYFTVNSTVISIPVIMLDPESHFFLYLQNWLGQQAVTEFIVTRDDSLMTIVDFAGPISRTQSSDVPIVEIPQMVCSPPSPAFWNSPMGRMPQRGLYPLFLPANTLSQGQHSFGLVVGDTATPTLQFDVRVPLSVRIMGGDRLLGNVSTLTLRHFFTDSLSNVPSDEVNNIASEINVSAVVYHGGDDDSKVSVEWECFALDTLDNLLNNQDITPRLQLSALRSASQPCFAEGTPLSGSIPSPTVIPINSLQRQTGTSFVFVCHVFSQEEQASTSAQFAFNSQGNVSPVSINVLGRTGDLRSTSAYTSTIHKIRTDIPLRIKGNVFARNISHHWETGNVALDLDSIQVAYLGRASAHLVISPKWLLPEVFYSLGRWTYRALDDCTPSFARLGLIPNGIPQGGDCRPLIASTLQRIFDPALRISFSCSDWADDDSDLPLTYAYFFSLEGGDWIQISHFTLTSRISLRVPPNVAVAVRIADKFNGWTQFSAPTMFDLVDAGGAEMSRDMVQQLSTELVNAQKIGDAQLFATTFISLISLAHIFPSNPPLIDQQLLFSQLSLCLPSSRTEDSFAMLNPSQLMQLSALASSLALPSAAGRRLLVPLNETARDSLINNNLASTFALALLKDLRLVDEAEVHALTRATFELFSTLLNTPLPPPSPPPPQQQQQQQQQQHQQQQQQQQGFAFLQAVDKLQSLQLSFTLPGETTSFSSSFVNWFSQRQYAYFYRNNTVSYIGSSIALSISPFLSLRSSDEFEPWDLFIAEYRSLPLPDARSANLSAVGIWAQPSASAVHTVMDALVTLTFSLHDGSGNHRSFNNPNAGAELLPREVLPECVGLPSWKRCRFASEPQCGVLNGNGLWDVSHTCIAILNGTHITCKCQTMGGVYGIVLRTRELWPKGNYDFTWANIMRQWWVLVAVIVTLCLFFLIFPWAMCRDVGLILPPEKNSNIQEILPFVLTHHLWTSFYWRKINKSQKYYSWERVVVITVIHLFQLLVCCICYAFLNPFTITIAIPIVSATLGPLLLAILLSTAVTQAQGACRASLLFLCFFLMIIISALCLYLSCLFEFELPPDQVPLGKMCVIAYAISALLLALLHIPLLLLNHCYVSRLIRLHLAQLELERQAALAKEMREAEIRRKCEEARLRAHEAAENAEAQRIIAEEHVRRANAAVKSIQDALALVGRSHRRWEKFVDPAWVPPAQLQAQRKRAYQKERSSNGRWHNISEVGMEDVPEDTVEQDVGERIPSPRSDIESPRPDKRPLSPQRDRREIPRNGSPRGIASEQGSGELDPSAARRSERSDHTQSEDEARARGAREQPAARRSRSSPHPRGRPQPRRDTTDEDEDCNLM